MSTLDYTGAFGAESVHLDETNDALTTGGQFEAGGRTFLTQYTMAGQYGLFSLDEWGHWSYTTVGAHDEFVAGQTYIDTFTVQTTDGIESSVTIHIDGTNDAAQINAQIADLVETDEVLSTGGQLAISDIDSDATFHTQYTMAGQYGLFSLDEWGHWNYVTTSARDEFVAGQTYTDTFTVRSIDGTESSVTVNILGTNDAAVIDAPVVDLVETGDALTTGGQLAISDADGEAMFHTQYTMAGQYGLFSLSEWGHWSYTTVGAHDEFIAGRTYTDTFTVRALDGTESSVTVNILGTNDAAQIDTATVDLVETDDALTAHGQLAISDIDSDATFLTQYTMAGQYGLFSLDEWGHWNYTTVGAHDEFVAGRTYTDTFKVQSADGTESSVTVNILGTNDAAQIDTAVVDLVETDDVLTTHGQLAISDVDSDATFLTQHTMAGQYGLFNLDEWGHWSYTTVGAHDEFVAGQTYTDTFAVQSADGTTSSVTINIAGSDDPHALISDTFHFYSTAESGLAISGFSNTGPAPDYLDLSGIDADITQDGDQAFSYGGESTALQAHGVTWFHDGHHTVLQMDTDGNILTPEMQLTLNTVVDLTPHDFVF